MKATKIVGTVIIILSIYLGYIGINKVASNSAEIKFLGLEIDASNESGKEKGYLMIGLALLIFTGGVYTLKK